MDYELLRETRMAAGVTQEAMADALGYKDKSSYCLLENGTVKCTVEQSKKIKRVLALSLEQYAAIFCTSSSRNFNCNSIIVRNEG